ncbi:hypothetical protein A9G48_01090 [Gilliamella sp. wkB18]|uniref:SHOCT domain-containing protein n=1 Tax=Gilliamella sp. wkB18 TaxID=3120260 RepID=UPI00080E33D1|nr:SHOCT domain-containing protein [Gilliamella apicola]OCG64995.1 hypothetical protein A9G48_01090 [Gilliamella apicola]
MKYCTLCQRNVIPKRKIGTGTLIGIIFTGFIWVLFIPFYKKRCPLCHGDRLVKPEKVLQNSNNHQAIQNPNISVSDELKKLNDLKESGVLSQEEFEKQKIKLLN